MADEAVRIHADRLADGPRGGECQQAAEHRVDHHAASAAEHLWLIQSDRERRGSDGEGENERVIDDQRLWACGKRSGAKEGVGQAERQQQFEKPQRKQLE